MNRVFVRDNVKGKNIKTDGKDCQTEFEAAFPQVQIKDKAVTIGALDGMFEKPLEVHGLSCSWTDLYF